MKSKTTTQDLFAQAKVGLGATHPCGSDRHGYFIAFVDPKTKTIGLYEPKHWFKHDWTDGEMQHEPFDPTRQPTGYCQAFRGQWYLLDRVTGARMYKYSLAIGHCSFYRDPSF